jgi:DNA anti-recombination protein RmuC
MQESIEQTEGLIKDNIRECERRIQAEETRRNEVHSLLQQISNLQNILKGSNKESGTLTSSLCWLSCLIWNWEVFMLLILGFHIG